MPKPQKFVQTYYGGYGQIRSALTTIGVKWTERDVLNNFWGKEFTVEKPRGKGAQLKMREIDRLFYKIP